MKRKKYDIEFKKNAIKLLVSTGKTQRELCEDLGVPYGLIGKMET